MRPTSRALAVLSAVACVGLSACGKAAEAPVAADNSAVNVEPIKGTRLQRITLTAEAARRVGIQTAPVVAGRGIEVIPYAAVMYQPDGSAYAYTSPRRLTYVRAPIVIDRIAGDLAYLRQGPKPGTLVVTVGSAELLGTEEGVQED